MIKRSRSLTEVAMSPFIGIRLETVVKRSGRLPPRPSSHAAWTVGLKITVSRLYCHEVQPRTTDRVPMVYEGTSPVVPWGSCRLSCCQARPMSPSPKSSGLNSHLQSR